ncbi:hypothetical protein BDZ89DRAFT_187389 [Hymenopellis radicata]|nr:hypothetical protein BDZ89DRAFT_187389 [Hymenopellis radicata]
MMFSLFSAGVSSRRAGSRSPAGSRHLRSRRVVLWRRFSCHRSSAPYPDPKVRNLSLFQVIKTFVTGAAWSGLPACMQLRSSYLGHRRRFGRGRLCSRYLVVVSGVVLSLPRRLGCWDSLRLQVAGVHFSFRPSRSFTACR